MTDLIPLTALGEARPRVFQIGDLLLEENTDLALASLYVGHAQPMPKPFGLELPDVGKMTAVDPVGAFWMGPGKWMVTADGKAAEDFAADLKRAVPDYAVTAQTDGFVILHLSGPPHALEALLSKLINLDPKALRPGCAVRTGLSHMTVFVLRQDEKRLALLGMRSFANSLWHRLEMACLQYVHGGDTR